MALSRVISKVGKKFCYPDAPANWVSATVERIERRQNYLPKKRILYPCDSSDVDVAIKVFNEKKPYKYDNYYHGHYSDGIEVKLEEYEDDEKYCFYRRRCRYKLDYGKYGGLSYSRSIKYEQLEAIFGKHLDDYEFDNEYSYLKKEGAIFDVVSMLSEFSNCLMRSNGDKVDIETTLRGKTVLVCCFNVPVFWSDDIPIRGLLTHYSASRGGNNEYEIVIVVKMTPNFANDEDAFNHFLSGFPSSCLAIPFQDTIGRNSVCANLGLKSYPLGLFVDNNQKVVYHKLTTDDRYGCGYFPYSSLFCPGFVTPWFKFFKRLDSFLDSDFVYKVKSNNFDDMWGDKVSVSELKDKLVGLYLCYDGTFIRTLDLISRECQAQNQEFQIVMVYFPYQQSVNPRFFMEAINHVLHNLNILSTNSNWWVSPFNDCLSRRIWEFYDYFNEDKLIILEPRKNYADRYGKYIFNLYGFNGYPFTSEVRVNKEMEAIRATTLESWLVYGSRDYVLRMNFNDDICNADKVPIAELHGKIILLYVAAGVGHSMYYDFLDWYDWNKTTRLSDFDVVFVSKDEQFHCSLWTSWFVCPYDPQYATFVQDKILKGRCDILAVFGKDGQIITLDGLDLLNSYGPKGFPSFEWYSGLRNEVIADLAASQEMIYINDLVD